MSVVKQSGSTDCGLFPIAISTALAHGLHPTGLHFRQEDMRSHLCECLEKKAITPIPIFETHRKRNFIYKTTTIFACPVCEKTMMETKWYNTKHTTCGTIMYSRI